MASEGIPSGQYSEYVSSVHGQALLQGQSKDAPTCASCHGSHGAAPPQAKSLNLVCAQCHPNQAENFQQSKHSEAAAAGKMLPCAGCHGAHGIKHPTDDWMLEICAKCHKPDSPEMVTARKAYKLMADARASYTKSEATMRDQSTGLPAEQLKSEVDEAKTALLKLAVVQHSTKLRDIEKQKVIIDSTADDIHKAQKELVERKRVRELILLYFLGFLGVSIIAFWSKRQRSWREWIAARDAARGAKR
jgi:hypothetical protein